MIPDDPVVIYDIMREAANRLCAFFAGQATVGGIEDPAIAEIWAIREEVNAVDTRDLDAQRQTTEDFRRRYKMLVDQREQDSTD